MNSTVNPLLSKETFCFALNAIKEQEAIYDEVTKSLEKIADGHIVLGSDNRYLSALLRVLKEAVNDQYDYIEWWLFEVSNDFMVYSADGKKSWFLKDAAALYDFITTEC